METFSSPTKGVGGCMLCSSSPTDGGRAGGRGGGGGGGGGDVTMFYFESLRHVHMQV